MALRTDRRCGATSSILFRVSAVIAEHAGIEDYVCNLNAPGEAQLHGDSNRISATTKERCNDSRQQLGAAQQRSTAEPRDEGNGKKQDQSQHQKKHGKLPQQIICRRKLIQVPAVTTKAVCGTTCTVWTKIRIAIRLQTSVVC